MIAFKRMTWYLTTFALVGLVAACTSAATEPDPDPEEPDPTSPSNPDAASLGIRTEPGDGASGVPLSVQPVVEVYDASGELLTSDNETVVTASLAAGGGSLQGTTSVRAAGGVVTFSNLTVRGTVGESSLEFSAADLPHITSAAFTLSPGPASLSASIVTASSTEVDVGDTAGLSLEVRDAEGNRHESGGLGVAFSLSGGTSEGTIGAVSDNGDGTYSATFTATSAGTATTVGATIDGEALTSNTPRITVTDDPSLPPPPPPPPPVGECTFSVDAADGNPEAAINSAAAGDVVCLTGTFDLSHTYKLGTSSNGVNNMLFVLTASGVTVNGSGALLLGDFEAGQNIRISTGASNTRLTGFTIDVGFIIIEAFTANVVVDFNTVRRAVFPNGNAGLIRSRGDAGNGATSLVITDNVIGDMYACNGSDCTSNSVRVPWNQINDVLHLGCVTKQGSGGGLHVIDRNVMDGCASLIFFKHPDDAATVYVRDNEFRNAQQSGKGGSVSVTPVTSGNTYANVGGEDCGSCWK